MRSSTGDEWALHPGRRLHHDSYAGNPVAVVLNAEELETGTMQGFARWTNLSETTFLLPAQDPTNALRAGFTVDQLADSWTPHLTMAEGLRLAASTFRNQMPTSSVPDRKGNGADSRAANRSGRWAVGALAAMVLCCGGHALLVAGALGGPSALVSALATNALVVAGGLLLLTAAGVACPARLRRRSTTGRGGRR